MRGSRHACLRSEAGLTLIEVMIATLILVVGILALLYDFDSSRKLTLVAERRTTAAHRAQQELERLQSLSYSQLAMTSAPTKSTNPVSPDYYVNYNSPVTCTSAGAGCFAYSSTEPTKEEPLVVSSEGAISPSATAWSAGDLSGYLYEFVTWHEDKTCGAVCEKEGGKNYKRLTVVLVVTTPKLGHEMAPIKVSMMIADPKAGGATGKNPLESPTTTCGGKSCTYGLSKGTSQTYFLHDTPVEKADGEKAVAPTASHTTHATVAATDTSCTATTTSTSCPVPDLMTTDTEMPSATTLYDYSTDLNSNGFTSTTEKFAGRALLADVACSAGRTWAESSTENSKGEFWVTKPLTKSEKLLGVGALSLYTQTLSGAAGEVTACVRIYDVPESLENLVKTPPTLVGYASYTLSAWPTSLTELSFMFEYLPTGTSYAISEKHRIGLRISTSTGNIGVSYDSTLATSLLQLNTE